MHFVMRCASLRSQYHRFFRCFFGTSHRERPQQPHTHSVPTPRLQAGGEKIEPHSHSLWVPRLPRRLIPSTPASAAIGTTMAPAAIRRLLHVTSQAGQPLGLFWHLLAVHPGNERSRAVLLRSGDRRRRHWVMIWPWPRGLDRGPTAARATRTSCTRSRRTGAFTVVSSRAPPWMPC